jgi:hypothetical protein
MYFDITGVLGTHHAEGLVNPKVRAQKKGSENIKKIGHRSFANQRF